MEDREPATSPADSELAALRREIDEIDAKLIQLLVERTQTVEQVGALKRKTNPGQCPIRAGREAEMVRRVIQKFENLPFPPAAAAALWRLLIGTSTFIEGSLKVSVFTPDRDDSLFWLSREYFGAAVPAMRQQHVKRVIGDVMDGKATVGVVPMLRGDDTSYWWTNLLQQGDGVPKIFAHVPFVYQGPASKMAPSALAIARITPEASGDDMSLFVLEADHNVSQHRLQTAFSQAKLTARWINIATLTPANRHHLIEVKGFFTPAHSEIKNLLAGLGPSIINVTFLGAYATPVTLPNKEQPATPHAVKPSRS